MNWVKLAIPSHSEPLWWEKIGKVANQAKLAILSHSEPLWWEKIGKVANWDDWLSHLSDEIQLKCGKSPPKSSKNENLIFGLHSTSDDWPSDPSNKS